MPPPVLAVDPGKKTGVAWWHPDAGFQKREIDGGLYGFISEMWEESDHIGFNAVVESFDPARGRGKVYYSDSSDVIGFLKGEYIRGNIAGLHFYSPAERFSTQDDDLKATGLWLPAEAGHGRDSARGLLRFMMMRPEYRGILELYGI